MTINLTEKKLSTLGSLPQNKKKILTDKLLLLKKNFLNSKSLKILVADSTSKEKDSSPWWNQSSMAMSLNLPLPTMTDLQESDLTSFSSFVNVHKQNLDYCQIKKIVHQKMNLQPNLFLSSLTLPQNSTVSENITYGRKIRFFPNQEQKIEFKKYFGATRFFYNKTIYSYNQNKFYLSLESARPIIMKKDSELLENELWMKEIPYDTKQLAVKSAVNALKTCFSQYRSGLIKKFKMSYKKAKDKKQIFFVDHRAIKNLCLFPSRLKENAELKVKKNKYRNYYNYIPESDVIIQKEGKKYYIIYTKTKEVPVLNYERKKIISLDPGIRTFQSFYTPEGIVGDIGNNQIKDKVLRLELLQDSLKSKISKCKQKRKKNSLKRRCEKLKTKVINIVKDFQWKISSFLCKGFKNVIIPEFKTQNMHSGLSPYNNRLLNLFSHYKFKEKLKHNSKKYNCNLNITTEEYTTKTCGACGNINNFIGASKLFWCLKCNIEMERDYQAARNILIKTITQGMSNAL